MPKRTVLTALLSFSIVLATSPGHPQTIAGCSVDNDDELFRSLTQVTQQTFERVHEEFDYLQAVQSAWRTVGMDAVLSTEAEAAAESLRKQWGPVWIYLTGFGAYAKQAADEVADRVFTSEVFNEKVQRISEVAIDALAAHFAEDKERLSEPLQFCMTQYLQTNYAPIIQGAASASFTVSTEQMSSEIDVGSSGTVGTLAVVLAGIVLVVTRRIARRIASRVAGGVARRVVAKLGARVIPIVGWLLLAYEVLFETTGAIPAIVKGVQDDQVVIGLQTEIANELRHGMNDQFGEISAGIASETMTRWNEFQRAHTLVLSLSETNPRFASYLKTFAGDDEIAPVSLGVSRILEIEGEEKLNDLIARGRIGEFLDLPEAGFAIARNLKDIDAALGWARVAGARFNRVEASGLYRLREPDDLRPATIAFLLDLENEALIADIAAISPRLIEAMPRFGARNVSRAGEVFRTAELETFMADMVAIDDIQARNIIWSRVPKAGADPAQFLAKVDTVRASRDHEAAADLVFANALGLLSPARIASALASVWSGDISWTVVRQRYAYVAVGALGALAILLLSLVRLLLPRRRRR